MDLDDLRRALAEAGSRPEIDVGSARAQVGARAHRRRRRHRSFASGIVVAGAVAVVVLVLAVAGGGPAREPVGVTVATGVTGPTNVVYERVPSRFDAAMAYDQARRRVVLFGGYDGSRMFADTWLWDGRGWSSTHPAAVPPAREHAAMAYDPATKAVVLFGGTVRRSGQTSLALDDTWTWNGATWTLRHPRHVPPWSSGLAMSFDARSHSLLLLTLPSSHPNLDLTPDSFGTHGSRTAFGTWRWDGSDWRELPTPSAPLFANGAVLHTNPRLVPLPHGAGLLFYSWSTYFGSCPPPARCNRPDPNGTRDSQTWTWDGTRWTEQHPSRAPVAGRLVATPGADGAPTVFASGGATWRWTGSRWAESRARGAAPPNDGFAVYDDVNAEVVAYAGQFPTGGLFYDTWTWDGSWTERYGSIAPVPTTAPPPTTTTSTVPTAGACTSAQLQLTLPHDAVAVMQQPVAFFALTNRSSSACALKGYPELTLYDASGNLIPATIRNGGAYMTNDPGPHPVVVQPGGRAYFGFAWGDVNNREGGTTKGCVSIARLRVFVPAISVSLATAAPLSPLFCPPGGSVTAIAAREAFKVATP